MTESHLMPAANTNPVAASVAPAMKSAVSNRVSFQSLRMLHLNGRKYFLASRTPSIALLEAAFGRQIGGRVREPPSQTSEHGCPSAQEKAAICGGLSLGRNAVQNGDHNLRSFDRWKWRHYILAANIEWSDSDLRIPLRQALSRMSESKDHQKMSIPVELWI
jgi:hypothetical protein